MNNIKNAIKTLSVSVLFFSLSTFAMFQPMTKKLAEQKKHRQELKKKLEQIKKITTIEEVDKEIEALKNGIFEKIITDLISITQLPYKQLKEKITTERIIAQLCLTIKYSNIYNHAENIPSKIYDSIMTILLKKNVKPTNIALEYEVNSDNLVYASTYNGKLIIPPFSEPHIKFYSALSEKSKEHIAFVCLHEFYHVELQHNLLGNFANAHPSIVSKIEEEADIHAASQDITMARFGKIHRCTDGHHPDILNQQSHCKDMTIMYALMQKKDELS